MFKLLELIGCLNYWIDKTLTLNEGCVEYLDNGEWYCYQNVEAQNKYDRYRNLFLRFL